MNEAEISGFSDDEKEQLVRDLVSQRTAAEGRGYVPPERERRS